MAGNKDEKEKLAPIVIKRIKKGGGGHHGGAWKVAYADFVTAMMAFFLLLWLLNVTTEEQKNAISNYFDPSHPQISNSESGAGGIMGGTSMSSVGAMVSTVQPISQPSQPDTTTRGEQQGDTKPGDYTEKQLAEELRKIEDARFKEAAEKIKAEIAKSPDLKDLQKNLLIDITPEGLRIQIVDDKGRSMFPSGSAKMFEFMHQLLLKVTSVITPLPNQLSVRGHTDSNKYKDPKNYDNWNLSADRAQASRRVIIEGGMPKDRIDNIMGRADREHLELKDPSNPRNRRISIILLRERLSQDKIEKLKSELDKDAAQKAAASANAKVPAKGGLEIIDDTKAPAPQTTTNVKAAPRDELLIDPDNAPLPVSPTNSTVRQTPQVIYFGDNHAEQKSDSLYDGPTQSPFVQAPKVKNPIIVPKELREKAQAHKEPQSSLDFGDAPPVTQHQEPHAQEPHTAATPPAATELQIINPTPSPTPKKVLDFGAVPEPTPGTSVVPPPETRSDEPNNTKELVF